MSKANPIEASEIFSILSDTINGANFDDLCDATHMIVNIAGYRRQKEGEWVAKSHMIRSPLARNYYCSACKYEPIEIKNYCPQCGARMKGGAE